jgi:FkbM family methyltransferase
MKHLLYCGARYAEKLRGLHSLYAFDAGWEVHYFEPNPFIDAQRALGVARPFGAASDFHRVAVWTSDGAVTLRLQCCDCKNGEGNAVGDLGSSNRRLVGGAEVTVPSIDLSRLVAGLDSEQVVVRMDIEGAEFPIVRKMVAEGTIAKVKDLHIEWHQRHLPLENGRTVAELQAAMEQLGVAVHVLS